MMRGFTMRPGWLFRRADPMGIEKGSVITVYAAPKLFDDGSMDAPCDQLQKGTAT